MNIFVAFMKKICIRMKPQLFLYQTRKIWKRLKLKTDQNNAELHLNKV